MQCKKKQILILGSTGTLGKSFRKYWSGAADVFYGVRSNPQEPNEIIFDMKQSTFSMRECLAKFDIVINCAAITQVDVIESDPVKEGESKEINWKSVERLADACLATETTLIHFSTDYVFGNNWQRPYCEDDMGSGTTNKYGFHKWCAEDYIKKSGCNYIIFRVSWLFSEESGNFLYTLFDKMHRTNETVYGVTDIISSPTYTKDIVDMVCTIISTNQENKIGVYHFTNEGVCTRYDFIVKVSNYVPKYPFDKIVAVDNSYFNPAARRPACSVMSKTKIKCVFGLNIRDWATALDECCHKIINNYYK